MKIKISILGSTGSIGKSLLEIISKNKNFEIVLLTYCNFKELNEQCKDLRLKCYNHKLSKF